MSLDPTAADAGLGTIGRGPDVALAMPLTARPGETVPFRWSFGSPSTNGALARTDALADAATLSAVLAGMTGAVLLFVTRWGRR